MARRDRSTGELLVLGIAITVCVFILLVGGSLVIIEILNPDADTSAGFGAVADVISTLIGLLAGFLAGSSDRRNGNSK